MGSEMCIRDRMCSQEVLENPESVEHDLSEVLDFLYPRQFNPLSLPVSWPTPKNQRYRASLRSIHHLVEQLVAERYNNYFDTGDLLSMLILARDPLTGQGMDRSQLHDELLTILMAGYETTSSALNWLWYLLAQHPEAVEKLQGEADRVLTGRIPTVDDLQYLMYTEMAFKEAMRLYPPVWMNARVCQQNDVIDGYRIPKNACVFICPYTMHRHPEYWDDPLRFDPERFNTMNASERPRFAYQPFGGGPRLCIGKHFAEMESKLAISMIAQRFSLKMIPGQEILPKPDLTLRSRPGIQMTIHRRKGG